MKLILTALVLLSSVSSLANTFYEFKGTSPANGEECLVSFNLKKGRYLTDLELVGPHTKKSLTRKDQVLASRVSHISSALQDEILTLQPSLLGEAYTASLNTSVPKVVTSKHKLVLNGENLESIQSIEVNSKLGIGRFGSSRINFECVDLEQMQ